jgi:hypothetical protein
LEAWHWQQLQQCHEQEECVSQLAELLKQVQWDKVQAVVLSSDNSVVLKLAICLGLGEHSVNLKCASRYWLLLFLLVILLGHLASVYNVFVFRLKIIYTLLFDTTIV